VSDIAEFESLRTYDANTPVLFAKIMEGMIFNSFRGPHYKKLLVGNITSAKIIRQSSAIHPADGTFLKLMYNTKKATPAFITDATLKSAVVGKGVLIRYVVGQNWSKPAVTKSKLRVLENYTPVDAAELAQLITIPCCKDSAEGYPISWASESLWQIYYDANMVEFAKRSVVVKLLAAEGYITIPTQTHAEFRWSGWRNITIPLKSITWTSKDVPELERLLANGHYSEMAQKQLTLMGH
jgi:hypothetical protein